jgi:zinc protease
MGEAATGATFPEEELVKARTRLLANIEARADEPDAVADTVGHALAFGKDHPYGEVATTASVSAIDRELPWAWYPPFPPAGTGLPGAGGRCDQGRRHGPGPCRLRCLEGFRYGDGRRCPSAWPWNVEGSPGQGSRGRSAHRLGGPTGQCAKRVARAFPTDLLPNDPLAMAAQVLNTILGGAVFNARLMQNLREDKGWTYGVHSSLEPDRWAGSSARVAA